MTFLFADLRSDLRIAVRQLRKQPLVVAVAVAVLALGIGANSAVFSAVDSVLLEPLPYPEPERLVDVSEIRPDGGSNSVSGGAYLDWRDHQTTFEHLAVVEPIERNLTGFGEPQRVRGFAVSANYLQTLGVETVAGRGFAPEAERDGDDARSVVVTDGFWRRHLQDGASHEQPDDPRSALGRTVMLDQAPHTVVGVLPRGALLDDEAQLLVPAAVGLDPEAWSRAGHWRTVVGRLAPGATPAAAEAELRTVKERLAAEYPSFKADWTVGVVPLQEIYRQNARPLLAILLATAFLVLLIACANVSSLLLARSKARTREIAVRSALGAHPWRIVRQMLVESLVLALLGCGAGLLVALFAVDLLAVLVAADLPEALAPRLDASVVAFTALLAAGGGLLAGVWPALTLARSVGRGAARDGTRSTLNATLRESTRGSLSTGHRRAQTWLVVGEVALTLVLLVAAGLMLRSFVEILEVDPGFEPRGVLAFDLSFSDAAYPEAEDRLALLAALGERLRALPGVEAVGSTSALPLSRRGLTERARLDGAPEDSSVVVITNAVDEEYFATLGIPLLRGRGLRAADDALDAEKVLVIDETLAASLFGERDPIGRSLRLLGASWRIVGVTAPVRHFVLDRDPMPTVYRARAHDPWAASLIVRSSIDPAELTAAVRAAVLEVDPDQPIADVRTLDEAVALSLTRRRVTVGLLGAFALVAVALASLGVYGLMAFTLAERRRELGIRAALGADRATLRRMLHASGARTALLGIALGLLAAVAGARVLESFLFRVDARDPWVFLGASLLLFLLSALSVHLPARRAARVDPASPLRGA